MTREYLNIIEVSEEDASRLNPVFPKNTLIKVYGDIQEFRLADGETKFNDLLILGQSTITTDASLLTSGTLPDSRLSNNIARTSSLTSKQNTLVNGTNIKSINNLSILGSGNLNITDNIKNNIFNVKDYGAIGDGIIDDTTSFKNCVAAAILAKGTILVPPPTYRYRITDTIIIKHPTNNECYVDFVGQGVPREQIRYEGAIGTSCFKFVGLRFSIWNGVKISLSDTAGLVAFDIDTIAPTSSTSFLTFNNCQVALGSGINQVGWRLGLLSENGGDISCLLWQNCSVFGANRDIVGQIGWSIRGSNTLHNVWVQCFGAFLNTMVSNKNGGNGANYFYGMGTSQNNLDFYIQNTSNWIIEGGRYELGRRLLEVGYDNKSPSITIKGLAIGSYDGIDGRLILADMPCSIEISGTQIAQKLTGNWTNQMIMLYGGQYGPSLGIGRLLVDGGSVRTDATEFSFLGNSTIWKRWIRGVGKLDSDGVATGQFPDSIGYIPLEILSALKETNLSLTANKTLSVTDWGLSNNLTIYANSTTAGITITLPNANLLIGYSLNIIKTDSSTNGVTITSTSNINDTTSKNLTGQYQTKTIKSNGTQYYEF